MTAAAVLTILKNGETIRSQAIEGEVVLGRAEGCVIRLEDRAVSRQHAVFRPASGGVQVEKKSAFAPLVVNGADCSTALLKDGDVISIGPYLLRLVLKNSPTPDAAPGGASVIPLNPANPTPLDATVPLAEAADVNSGIDGDLGTVPVLEDVGVERGDAPVAADPGAIVLAGAGEADLQSEQAGLDGVTSGEPGAPTEEPIDLGPVDEDGKTKVGAATKLDIKLVFAEGAANVQEYDFKKDEVSLGRGKNCDIVLNDKKSSRKHAIIRRAGLFFVIKDLDSANGTFVNGARVKEQQLAGDDVVRIGDVEFQFLAISADYAAQEKDFIPVPTQLDEPEPPGMDVPFGAAASSGAADGMQPPQSSQPGALAGMGPVSVAGETTGGVSGLHDIPGLTTSKKKQGLYEKYVKNFKTLPVKQKIIVAVVGLALVYFLVFDEDPPAKTVKKTGKNPAHATAVATGTIPKGPATFESLSPENRRFVETQHTLAFDHYRNKDYDKALYEIRKIFDLIPDYKDSKEIERYALEGKRKLDALEEEKRKKDEEARIKAKVAELVEETRQKMAKQDYEGAQELFSQILAIDPDNPEISKWKKTIEDYQEQQRINAQAKQVQIEINQRAWSFYKEGLALKKQGRYHPAIEAFGKVADIGANDRRITAKAKTGIAECRAAIKALRDPLLAEAKQAEEAQDFGKAYQVYKKATQVDPPHPDGYAGMARVRGTLHEKAKVIYTEAILAESYSDFTTAKKKFKEILTVAPEDDIYYQRAEHKLSFYFKKDDHQP